MSVFDKVRRWIDGDSAETVLEEAARDAQVKPRSIAEEFIVKLARAVEEVMQREMVPLPQGTTLIPTEYIIFLSDADDKEWQGVKRKGLEQGLYHVLAERAKEISGKKKLETQSFAVELRVDGTLEKGDIRVQHSWEDSASGKTSILSRSKSGQQSAPKIANPVTPVPSYAPQTNPIGASMTPPSQQPIIQQQELPSPQPQSAFVPPTTQIPTTAPQIDAAPYVPPSSGDSEEMTRIKKRQAPELYKLEIWRGGVRQSVVPVYQAEVSLGRGSKSKPVDIPLSGDPEISRRHVTIYSDNGNFWLASEGRNPLVISGREIPPGQRAEVAAGEPITVCSYLLRIQPK